jgi:hypothetical protein
VSIDTADNKTPLWTRGNRLVGYDPQLRRLWVGGQRLHHGATGVALAGLAVANLVTRRNPRGLAYLLAGSAMVAHDWKDRAIWFQRGPQNQPAD